MTLFFFFFWVKHLYVLSIIHGNQLSKIFNQKLLLRTSSQKLRKYAFSYKLFFWQILRQTNVLSKNPSLFFSPKEEEDCSEKRIQTIHFPILIKDRKRDS